MSLLISLDASATHNRAGEITYTQIGDLTIEATITTYTKASSIPADRDSLEICWGDGTCEWVLRSNGTGNPPQGIPLANDTKKNIYIATHTYPGQGHYQISMNDPNRNGGICNVNPPGSDNVPFHLTTTVTLLNSAFQGPNNSPVLLQPPIDIGCVGQTFTHNPNAYDPDGDSLSYHLIVPQQDNNTNVPNYLFPNEIEPGPNNLITLNPTTGEFVWFTPQQTCEYNIAFIIVQYRNGMPIDTMIRDMQILIEECDNEPPVIEAIDEICVVAGETVSFDVRVTAPIEESDQKVSVEVFGGPMIVDDPAVFNVAQGFQDQPLIGTFVWDTKCRHISDQYYSVVFRAEDDFPIFGTVGDTSFLSSLHTVRIKVVGPAPQDVQAEPGPGMVEVSWENPYDCENAADDYFYGFSVWRREGSNNFPIDTCTPGLDGRGYTKIVNRTRDTLGGRYYYKDTDVERGRTYCYRILGEFAQTSAGGFPFNRVESLPSEEKCVQLSRDVPFITNVTVNETDVNNGIIEVRWTTPDVEDLDTLLNPGPYSYKLLRATGITTTGFEEIVEFSSLTFAGLTDTMYIDSMLNTAENPYTYKVAFFVNGEPDELGSTREASSVFLSVASTDEINNLSWEESVPWDNYSYTVYKWDGTVWDSIGVTTEPNYSDTGLTNGVEYCYYVQSTGTYGIDGIPSPLFNDSQEACGIPLDSIPPCPPVLTVSNICNDNNPNTDPEVYINNLIWTNPNNACPETDDVLQYNVFYAVTEGSDFELVETINTATDTTYEHRPDLGIAGCYAVTAIDSVGNESRFSNIICVDNCPIYNLPNVFTPNDDGANDLFIPFPYRFIERIDMQIFNRWGQLVFETTDPEINWNGVNLGGKDLAEGVYFYTVTVFEQRVSGVFQNPEVLSGYIHLIRSKK